MPRITTETKCENYNIGEGKGVVPHCPPEKEEAIKDALRHFGIIGLNQRRYLRVHMVFLDHIAMGMFGI